MGPAINTVILLCSLVTSVSAAAMVFVSAFKKAGEPNRTQDKRIDALEDKTKLHDTYLTNDKLAIEDLKKARSIELRALDAILVHDISGNNEQELRDSSKEIKNYLMDHVSGKTGSD